ncbi:MAG: ThiF family adenylyltransferase [Phycisphaeraceae bacterium]
MIHTDRDLRQRSILPPEALASCSATVIGVGAVGRQVALQLAAVGVPKIQLVDFDIVEPVNLAAQGYLEADLGRMKVEATAAVCRQLNSGVEIIVEPERFRRSRTQVGDAVFCCVDSIDTRKFIWEAVRDRVLIYIDGRMSAEVIRVLAVADEVGRQAYQRTLFPGAQAFTGSCTARSTIFAANICAGLMVGQFARWLRKMPVDADLTLNLLASEMTVT